MAEFKNRGNRMNQFVQIMPADQIVAIQNDKRDDRANNIRWAQNIKKFWHDRGFPQVTAIAVEEVGEGISEKGFITRRSFWTIKTNLINGLPPRSNRFN